MGEYSTKGDVEITMFKTKKNVSALNQRVAAIKRSFEKTNTVVQSQNKKCAPIMAFGWSTNSIVSDSTNSQVLYHQTQTIQNVTLTLWYMFDYMNLENLNF